jgi:carotenoid 1,2-hydratase
VFSPYYAWARRRGGSDPLRHCAVNVALYGRGGKRWAMTERGADAIRRSHDQLAIGPSEVVWDKSGLTVHIDEVSVPLPRRIRGRVQLLPAAVEHREWMLDPAGRHRWRPIAPCARADVVLDSPALRWSGDAYLDCNTGDRPLEADFLGWDWSRAVVPGGTAILYDVRHRDVDPTVQRMRLALLFRSHGGVEAFPPPPTVSLAPTIWRIERCVGVEPGHVPEAVAMEDTPFYARSIVTTRLLGQSVQAIHETLSLERFRAPWVQAMLPFRMPRRLRRFNLG